MEKLMQYIWQHRLWPQQQLHTTDGKMVRIIDPGQPNNNAGPDFFNAKVVIGNNIWAGDVEIHVKASDWHRHKHDGDPAYNSVILHVVERDDTSIERSDGQIIPQMLMPCAPDFAQRYDSLTRTSNLSLPCASFISELPAIHITSWISALAFERLYAKADRAHQLLDRLDGDWESVCYVTIARSLGFGLNNDAFERLALSLPLRFIGKHSDSLLSIEALLFGQSGLLDTAKDHSDPYVERLKSEYRFLAHKFGLRQPESLGWKMARTRPANFPHRRIALLSTMLHGGFRLMSRIIETLTPEDARSIFMTANTGYWASRYNFGPSSGHNIAPLSASSANIVLINAVCPLLYAYGAAHNDTALMDRAVALLQHLPPEHNSIVGLFSDAGIKAADAFTSQALIQLRREYCEQRKCLYCRIGHRMLAASAPRQRFTSL